MAMPASGTLYLCNPSVTGTCQSIAHAVYGASPPATVNLTTVGSCAGFTTPINMSCFYGYTGNSSNISAFFDLVADNVEEFDGSVDLVCNSNSVVHETINISIKTDRFQDTFTAPENTYYIDFRGVQGYNFGTPVSTTVSWSWNIGRDTGVDTTGTFSVDVNVDGSVRVT